MTETTTNITMADLRERLRVEPWRHTYDGIPIWETDDGEQVMTLGQVDEARFAAAYEAYLRDVCGTAEADSFAAAGFAWTDHRKARFTEIKEFPGGEIAVTFDDEGGVDVTVGSI